MKKIIKLRNEMLKKTDEVYEKKKKAIDNNEVEKLKKLEKESSRYMELMFSIDTFFECKTADKYEEVLNFIKGKGHKRVFDIGCAYGLQSIVFEGSNVEYIGVDACSLDFFNSEKITYIKGEYPFNIKTNKNDIAISFLCLGWNCYLYEGEVTINNQFKSLSKDFSACILDVPSDKYDTVLKYFPKMHKINEKLVYFYK